MTDYAAITDWVAYIRDAIATPGAYPELGGDTLAVDAGLSKVGAELAPTPYGPRFADAALRLLEQGTPAIAEQLLQIPLGQAPAAGARVAAVARSWWGTPLEDRIRTLLLRGLEADARDPQLLAALADFALRDSTRAREALGLEADARDPQLLAALADFALRDSTRAREALGLAVPHNIDWVAAHVDLLPASFDPDGRHLRALAVRTEDADLPRLLAGIAAAGPDFVQRLVSALRAPDAVPHQVQQLRPFLAAQPAFAGLVP